MKLELIDRARAVIERLAHLNARWIEAIQAGDIQTAEPIDREIDDLQKKREAAMQELKAHARKHGC